MLTVNNLAGFGASRIVPFAVNAAGSSTTGSGDAVTFSSLSVPTPSNDRWVIACVGARDNAVDAAFTMAVTIDGIAATEIHKNIVGASSHTTMVGWWYVKLPSGTSIDVTATATGFAGTFNSWLCQLYEVEGLDLTNAATATGTANVTIDPTGERLVLVAAGDESGALGSWTGGNISDDAESTTLAAGHDASPPQTSTAYDYSNFSHNHAAIAIPVGFTDG